MAANWLKATLFGRQLSHGSENDSPETFDDALQQQRSQGSESDNFEDALMQQTYDFQPQQSYSQSGQTPGVSEMNAAYIVSHYNQLVPCQQTALVPCILNMQVSNQLVRDRMQADDVKVLDSVVESDIVCVRGTYDHIHLVLEAVGVPFSHISPQKLASMELKPEQTVYVNCPCAFPSESAHKLEKFVREGGQLITTDWALKHVLETAFPKTVKYSGRSTGDEVVAVEIVDKNDEVLKGSHKISNVQSHCKRCALHLVVSIIKCFSELIKCFSELIN